MTQAEALRILKTGANVFLTGEPGSGKTHTVNEYVSWLRSCGIEPSITASTGIAATHIGGMTIHAWSGIGVRRTLSAYDLDAIAQNKSVVRRVADARVLIIDEVSMLSARVLSMVDAVCREVRRSDAAFGGLTVVLVGDFFQLPPVSRRDEDEQATLDGGDERERFAYESPAWSALAPLVCYLTEQHRQEDGAFLEFLSAVRASRVGESHMVLLRKRYSPKARGGVTELYSHNADVDVVNDIELSRIPGEARVFEMEHGGPERLVASLRKGCLSPEKLTLKVGAKVMFTKNDLERRYVNGTLGEVEDFDSASGFPLVRTLSGFSVLAAPEEWRVEDSGKTLARITQVPLRLAWAMTVHKSQGLSLDAAHMDLSRVFEYGQGYVALSRVRALSGLSLAGLSPRALEVHPDIREMDERFRDASARAGRRFAEMDDRELAGLHERFVHACGGKIGMGRRQKKLTEKIPTHEATLALLKGGKTLGEAAAERGMTLGTILSHVEKLVAEGKIDPLCDLAHIEKPKRYERLADALLSTRLPDGSMPLSAARSYLGSACSYDDLRLARLFVR